MFLHWFPHSGFLGWYIKRGSRKFNSGRNSDWNPWHNQKRSGGFRDLTACRRGIFEGNKAYDKEAEHRVLWEHSSYGEKMARLQTTSTLSFFVRAGHVWHASNCTIYRRDDGLDSILEPSASAWTLTRKYTHSVHPFFFDWLINGKEEINMITGNIITGTKEHE